MSISVLSAAKYIGELSDWAKTNLELQKIIYIAHMIHLGQKDGPLINEKFEAWVFGPVVSDLYHRAKIYGADPVKNIFINDISIEKDNDLSESEILSMTYDMTKNFSSSRLIAITHWKEGAWAKNYQPGNPNAIIPDEDILDEYNKRVARANKK